MILSPTKHRPGVTLLEVTLTLAVIALLAGLAAPALLGWLANYRLTEALNDLRADWLRARTRAMEEGRAYRFVWNLGTANYQIAPDEDLYWPELAGSENEPPASDGTQFGGWQCTGRLPDGIVFVEGWTDSEAALNVVDAILFQPDGSARILAPDGMEPLAVLVALSNAQGSVKALRLRALTALVAVVGSPTN